MNILYITEILPYFPCGDGFRLVAYNILKRLSADNTIHLLAFYRTNADLENKKSIKNFCESIETVLYKKPSFIKKILTFFRAYSWDNEMRDKITRAIDNYNIDIIFAEGANIGQYVYKIKNLPKIIAPHDSSSARNYQFFQQAKPGIQKLPHLIRWIKSAIYEKLIYSKFDHCIVVGPNDADNLKKLLPNLKISIVTNGVDTEYYKYNPPDSTENNIIFTGNMSYLPNADAALYFYTKIFPLIRKKITDVKLYLAGANPADEIRNLANDKQVIVTGAVDDLRTFIHKSAVYVCPLRLGTGIKNKILEAMAIGIPIVATKISTPGININDGNNIMIADAPDEFANKVIELLSNQEKRLTIAKNARDMVETRYSWETKVDEIKQILNQVKGRSITHHKTANILGIGLDYLMLKDDKVRGDVRTRQSNYAKSLTSFHQVVYSPKELGFKKEKWADNLYIYPSNSKNKGSFILDALKIASRICGDNKIDAITTEDPFTTGVIGYLLKKRFKIPLNIQVHIDFCDNQYWINLRKINKIFNVLAKFILKRADTIRVGTQHEKDKLVKKIRINPDKISVIPVNADLSKFREVNGIDIRKHYLNGKYDKLVLFAGRLVAQKDIPTLLKAFKIVLTSRPSTLLVIGGSGTQEQFLKRAASELAIDGNTIFTGNIPHEKIPQYLAACDLYVVSSIFEGTCIAMAEAMAAAKPVVATKFAGARDLISDGENGFIVEQRDHERMADRIIHLLNNRERAKEMGIAASKKIEEYFANNKNIGKVIELWQKTAGIQS